MEVAAEPAPASWLPLWALAPAAPRDHLPKHFVSLFLFGELNTKALLGAQAAERGG